MFFGKVYWTWWILCKDCGHRCEGTTDNFHTWGCPKCGSHNIKGGIETEKIEEE